MRDLTREEALAAHRATPVRWLAWRTNLLVATAVAVAGGLGAYAGDPDLLVALAVAVVAGAAGLVVGGVAHADVAARLHDADAARDVVPARVATVPWWRTGRAVVELDDGRTLAWWVGPGAGMPPAGTRGYVLDARRGDLTRLLFRRDDGSVGIVDPAGTVR